MATQDEFLDTLWRDNINGGMDGKWIPALIADANRRPDGAFAEVGPILKKMLDAGISKEDICRVLRFARYEALFDVLVNLEEDPLPADEFEGIHESLLTADPSGLEAGPGSWPLPKRQSQKKGKQAAATAPLLTVKRSFRFAFSPVARLVAASDDGKIWNLDSGQEVTKCKLYPNTVDLQFSPDGSRLAGLNTGGIVAVFDAKSGERIFTQKMGKEGSSVRFSPDGKLLLADNWDGKLFGWHAISGKPLFVRDLGDVMIESIASRKQGDWALLLNPTGGLQEHHLSIWDRNFETEVSRKTIKKTCMQMELEPSEGKRAIALLFDEAELCEVPSGKTLGTLSGDQFKDATFSPDKKWIAIVDDDEFVVASVPSLEVVARRKIKYANSVSFSTDGSLIGLASWKQGEIWDFSTFSKANPV